MTTALQHNFCIRHGLLVVPTITWLLLFAGLLESEVLRAILAIVCIASMLWQWLRYRSRERGAHFVFLSLMVSGFTLASVWLLLNAARYYTYDGESGRSHVYPIVVSTQETLVWLICVLMFVVSIWALFEFAHWVGGRLRSNTQVSER